MTRPRVDVRHVAIVAVAFVVLGWIGLASAAPVTDTSSQGAGRTGTAAAFDWLGRLGYSTHRIDGTFDLSGTDTLVMVAPLRSVPDAESLKVRDLLDAGGQVIVAVDSPFEVKSILALADVGVEGSTIQTTPRVADSAMARQVGDTEIHQAVVWQPPAGADTILDTDDGPVGIRVHVGSGSLWLLGSPFLLDNDGLRAADNAHLLLYIAEQSRGGHIGFDDLHHAAADSSAMSVIFVSPVGLGLLLGIIVVIVGVASSGRRIGRAVRLDGDGRVPSAADHVTSMGQMFQRSADRASVAQRTVESLRFDIARLLAVDRHAPDAEFVALVAAIDAPLAAALEKTLAHGRSMAATRPAPAALVRLAQECDEVIAMIDRVPA